MDFSMDVLQTDLYESECKFKKACEQVVLLNDRLEGLQKRYDKAREENHRSFRYNLRLRMATVEGVRNAYYEYACEKAERIAEMRCELHQMEIGMASDSEAENDSYQGEGSTFDGNDTESDPEMIEAGVY